MSDDVYIPRKIEDASVVLDFYSEVLVGDVPCHGYATRGGRLYFNQVDMGSIVRIDHGHGGHRIFFVARGSRPHA